MNYKWLAFATIVLVVAIAWLLVRRNSTESGSLSPDLIIQSDDPYAPRQVLGTGAGGIAFVEDRLCAECHQVEYDKWIGSHHDLAMQPAIKDTVLGDFDNTTFTLHGVTSRFYRKGGKFFVNTDGPDGKLTDYQILYTFGVTPLQQYLVAMPGGRLQCLTIAWDTEQRRWYSLYPDEKIEPGDAYHWTGVMQNWNHMCAECHSTNLQKNYDPDADVYRTTFSAIDVGCQACHGPGAAHIEWARSEPEYDADDADQNVDTRLAVDYRSQLTNNVEACQRCHAFRHQVSVDDRHGRAFTDDFMIVSLQQGQYHPDGQILGEVYVTGSFMQSKMYHSGVRCNHCHDPPSLELLKPGNHVCIQCHSLDPIPAFNYLDKKDYNDPAHHFHQAGGEGSQCVDCHMIQRNFMGVDPRRDHSFRIPRPDLTISTDSPNACNDCHSDKSAQWALDHVVQWYGPGTYRQPHFGQAFAMAHQGSADAAAPLADLMLDPNAPAIVRATAAELVPYVPSETLHEALQQAATDKNPVVRYYATGSLEVLPILPRRDLAVALLSDPSPGVRQAAARQLSFLSPELIPQSAQEKYREQLDAYIELQRAASDRPEGNLNLAIIYQNLRQFDKMEAALLKAINQDDRFLPARNNLAVYYSAIGRAPEALQCLEPMAQVYPDNGEIFYSLGLLTGQMNRYEQAIWYLQRATELLPDRADIWYNYALSLQHADQRQDAELALLRAHDLDRSDVDTLYALAVFYIQQQDLRLARTYLQSVLKLDPQHRPSQQMLQRLQMQLNAPQN